MAQRLLVDTLHNLVIPVKTGIQREILGRFVWIPAYAGMTCRVMQHVPTTLSLKYSSYFSIRCISIS